MKLLVIDTETGGLNPVQHDLLTVGLVALDDEGIRAMVDYKIIAMPYRVTYQSTQVNGIEVHTHNRSAEPRFRVRESIHAWIDYYFGLGAKVTLAGWNVGFDIQFFKTLWYGRDLKGQTLDRSWWDDRIHYRSLDIQSVVQWLEHSVGNAGSLSLDEALDLYGVKFQGDRHTAPADALATARLYQRLIHLGADNGLDS